MVFVAQAVADARGRMKLCAEAEGVTRQGADYRLRQLREDGPLRSKKVGRELVWMLAEDGSAL